MITIYRRNENRITAQPLAAGQALPPHTVWVDLRNPTNDECALIAHELNLVFPEASQLGAIEASSRFYSDAGVTYLTLDLLVGVDAGMPALDAVLIAVTQKCLVTLRHCEPRSLDIFAARIQQDPELFDCINMGLLSLLDAISDRIADIIEALGNRVDTLSERIFHPERAQDKTGHKLENNGRINEVQLQVTLRDVGRSGDMVHKIRASVSGMMRLVSYLDVKLAPQFAPEQKSAFQALKYDVQSLGEHAQFAANEIQFLLDATLGQINIEQNNIIKIFSIVAVVFLPPTLFASMWGMNFHNMPELSTQYGYYCALCVMLTSAILPLVYFKRKGWM